MYRLLMIVAIFLNVNSASALNILLTNDDGWNSHNSLELKSKLVAAGHDVILLTPCLDQSGKGGALTLLKNIPLNRSRAEKNEYCVGDTDQQKSYADYTDGTPAVAALYGIRILAQQRWGRLPDLLISGPNFGNNMGMMHSHSGTLSGTMVSLGKGVPSIGVSAATESRSKPEQATFIADVVMAILQQLIDSRAKGQPLLPEFIGLNVNIPPDPTNHKGLKFTRAAWNSSVEVDLTADLSKNKKMMAAATAAILRAGVAKNRSEALQMAKTHFAGAKSITFDDGNLGDTRADSEGTALDAGHVTISVIDGSIQAPQAQSALINKRLTGLRIPADKN